MNFTLIAEGTSDGNLIPLLEWLLLKDNLFDEVAVADASPNITGKCSSFADRIAKAVRLFPADFYFIHRDADQYDPFDREQEVLTAADQAGILTKAIPVIPVRTSEAWFFFDEAAIRRAAGNPRGAVNLKLPKVSKVESLSDPKRDLFKCLTDASELSGRRLKQFRACKAYRNLANEIKDYSPILSVTGIQRVYEKIQNITIN